MLDGEEEEEGEFFMVRETKKDKSKLSVVNNPTNKEQTERPMDIMHVHRLFFLLILLFFFAAPLEEALDNRSSHSLENLTKNYLIHDILEPLAL